MSLKRLPDILDPLGRTPAAKAFRLAYHLAVAVGLGGAVSISSKEIFERWEGVLSAAILIAAIFFSVEYILRLKAASSRRIVAGVSSWRLRWRLMTSLQGLIGLAAVVPLVLILVHSSVERSAQLFTVLWAFKLFRYAPGSVILARVLHLVWRPLFSVFIAFIVVLLTAATLIHLLEGDVQPETYGSIPLSLWWTVVTLTNTGYGDVTPITVLGRTLASGVRRSEFLRNWDLIAHVPMCPCSTPSARKPSPTFPGC